MNQHKMVERVLFTYEQIEEKTKGIAKQLNERFAKEDNTPVMLGILRGSIPFFSLLLRHIEVDVITDYMLVSSYRGGLKSTGSLQIKLDVNVDITDRDVIIVEDIVDTGLTLSLLKKMLFTKGAKSVTVVSMLNKLGVDRVDDVQPDYKCFDIENEFVIGFGLDLFEKLRNLPYVAVCNTDLLEEFENEK